MVTRTRLLLILAVCFFANGCRARNVERPADDESLRDEDIHPAALRQMRGWIAPELLRSPQHHDMQRIIIGKPGHKATFGANLVLSPGTFIDSTHKSFEWYNVAVLKIDADDDAVKESKFEKGTYCFYLINAEQYPDIHLQAKYMKVNGNDCPEKPGGGSHWAYVKPSPEQDSVPKAVRLHVSDEVARKNHLPTYVGVPCYRNWCTISPVTYKDHAPPLPKYSFKEVISGWHDEQYISYLENGTSVSSAARARVSPVDTLGKIEDYSKWKVVAHIDIGSKDPAALDDIKTKWRLPNYNWESPVLLSLIRENGKFFARYSYSNGAYESTSKIPTPYVPNPQRVARGRGLRAPIEVPGTARWGIASDGTVWVRCADGCCTVS